MAESYEIIGYDSEDDFNRVAAAVRDYETTLRPQAGVKKKKRTGTYDTARVMILGPEFPIYSPRSSRQCAYFLHDLTRDTITIEMFGDDLAGFIDVYIDGVLYRTNCQSSTEELREFFGFDLATCRVTAFPGYWEFAFSGSAPTITAEPGAGYSPLSNRLYTGGVVVTYEGWVSADDGNGGLDTLELVDTIPFAEGEVKPGAIAIARFSNQVGWFVEKWQCREFRFYPETA